jgi:hypothetical protein
MQAGEAIESYTAVLPGTKPKSYRVTIEPYAIGESNGTGLSGGTGTSSGGSGAMLGGFGAGGGISSARGPGFTDNLQGSNASPVGAASGPMPTELVSVKVELFESESASSALTGVGATGSAERALIELTRLVRRPVVVQEEGRSAVPTGPSGRQMGL